MVGSDSDSLYFRLSSANDTIAILKNKIVIFICTRSLTDRTKASDAFNAGSIPVGCIYITLNKTEKGKL